MSAIILNAPLTTSFQPSLPIVIAGERITFHFKLVVGGQTPVRVSWYLEFSEDNPILPTAEWYREVAEEDIGNGDVRMPISVRRFSMQGSDADLTPGTYFFSVQLHRAGKMCRIQMAGEGCSAVVRSVFGDIPTAP